jgi:dynactin complex subunit
MSKPKAIHKAETLRDSIALRVGEIALQVGELRDMVLDLATENRRLKRQLKAVKNLYLHERSAQINYERDPQARRVMQENTKQSLRIALRVATRAGKDSLHARAARLSAGRSRL